MAVGRRPIGAERAVGQYLDVVAGLGYSSVQFGIRDCRGRDAKRLWGAGAMTSMLHDRTNPERRGAAAIGVALVDDHRLFRQSLASFLSRESEDIEVRASVASVAELCGGPGWGADVVLLDLKLNDGSSVEDNVRLLTGAGSRVAVVSAYAGAPLLRRALRAGALGYVPKTADAQELLDAIRGTAAGERYTSEALTSVLLASRDPEFSGQELRSLVLYAAGMPMKTVAHRLNVSQGTVKDYIDRVREKYDRAGRDARTRIGLYKCALEDGYLAEG